MKTVIQSKEGKTIYQSQDSVGILFRYLPLRSDGTLITDLDEMSAEEKAIWLKQIDDAFQDDYED